MGSVRTAFGDVAPDQLGPVLAHEHVFTRFGDATGEADLDYTAEGPILAELRRAHAAGIRTLVEASTWDMRPDPRRIERTCRSAGLRLVKTTGWFRSPTADLHVCATSVRALVTRLMEHIESGLGSGAGRAGALGETGISGTRPTTAERRILDATSQAARQTGAAVLVHTDDWANALAAMDELETRGVPLTRVVLGHLRCADPPDEQLAAARAGVTLSFDQLGHPLRDPIEPVAERIGDLIRSGVARIAISSDLGRLSRLPPKGSGCARPVKALMDRLRVSGIEEEAMALVAGGAMAQTLALHPVAGT